jgi:hypothetical protein
MRARHLVDPLALIALGAGAATAAATGLWVIAPLGVAAWGVLAWQAGDRDAEAPAPPPPGPPPEPPLPPPQQAAADRLAGLAERIASEVAAAGPTVKTCFSEVLGQLAQVRSATRALLKQQARVERFIAEHPAGEVEAALAALERSRAGAADAVARERYEQAIAQRRDELANLERIRGNGERIAAELAEAEGVLRSTLSRVVSLDSSQGDLLTGASEDVRNALGDMLRNVAALDRVLAV